MLSCVCVSLEHTFLSLFLSLCAHVSDVLITESYAPTNVPIEKTDQRGDKQRHQPAWPTHSENDIMPQFRGLFDSVKTQTANLCCVF